MPHVAIGGAQHERILGTPRIGRKRPGEVVVPVGHRTDELGGPAERRIDGDLGHRHVAHETQQRLVRQLLLGEQARDATTRAAYENTKALQTEGFQVTISDIAGARFVPRGDARVLEEYPLAA